MKKMIKRWICLIIAIAMIVPLFASNPVVVTAQAATKPMSMKKNLTVNIGKRATLNVKNWTKKQKKVKWSVKDKSIVALYIEDAKSCTIIALQPGKTTVTAKVGKKKFQCTVTVPEVDKLTEVAKIECVYDETKGQKCRWDGAVLKYMLILYWPEKKGHYVQEYYFELDGKMIPGEDYSKKEYRMGAAMEEPLPTRWSCVEKSSSWYSTVLYSKKCYYYYKHEGNDWTEAIQAIQERPHI